MHIYIMIIIVMSLLRSVHIVALFVMQFASCTSDVTETDDLVLVKTHLKRLESQVTSLEQTVQELTVDNTNLKRDNRIQLDQFKNDLDKLQQGLNTSKTGEMRIMLLATGKNIKYGLRIVLMIYIQYLKEF